MRHLAFLALMLGSSLSLLTGCAADAASSPASVESNISSPSEPPGISAEIGTGSVTQTIGQCHVDVKTVSVRVPDAAITTKINEALRFDAQRELDVAGTDCTRSLVIDAKYKVVYNRWNLLSVVYSEYFDVEGAAHPSEDLRTWNFDLETGELIDLRSALDAEGLAMLVDACKAAPHGDDFADACENAVKELPVWEIESSGIRIHPIDVPHAAWDVAVNGASVSWMPLNGHFKEKALRAIAP